jgi:hypothetical protein
MIGILLLTLVVALAYPIARMLPYGWEAQVSAEVPTGRPGKYGPRASFYISAHGVGRGPRAHISRASVHYGGVDVPGSLEVDLDRMTYRLGLYGYGHLGERPLNRNAMLDYLSRGGFARDSAEAGAVADQILGELQSFATASSRPTSRANLAPAKFHRPATTWSVRTSSGPRTAAT